MAWAFRIPQSTRGTPLFCRTQFVIYKPNRYCRIIQDIAPFYVVVVVVVVVVKITRVLWRTLRIPR